MKRTSVAIHALGTVVNGRRTSSVIINGTVVKRSIIRHTEVRDPPRAL